VRNHPIRGLFSSTELAAKQFMIKTAEHRCQHEAVAEISGVHYLFGSGSISRTGTVQMCCSATGVSELLTKSCRFFIWSWWQSFGPL